MSSPSAPEPSAADDPPAQAKSLERAVAVACVLVMVGFGALVLTYRHGRDQGIYAMVARVMVEGGMPYRDAWDFKPPGIFFFYALARLVFGASQTGIRVVEVAGMAGAAWAMVRWSELALGDRLVGFVAGALVFLCHAQLDFWHTAQPESFGGMLTVAALVAAERSGAFGSRLPSYKKGTGRLGETGWLAVSGALFGCTGLLKPPLAGGGAVLALFLAAEAYTERGGVGWLGIALRRALAVAAGGAAPFVLTLAFFAARGALGDLYDVLFVFTPHYTKLSWEQQSVLGMGYWGVKEWLVSYASPNLVGLALLACFGPRLVPSLAPRAPGSARPSASARPLALAGAIIAVHLAGVVMQGKFFPYHYGATWYPTALVAAVGWVNALRWAERRGSLALAGVGLLVWLAPQLESSTKHLPTSYLERTKTRLAMLRGELARPATDDALATVADVDASANRAVAEWISSRTAPTDRVFVWGFEPVIYDLANRPISSRFLYNVPQRVGWSSTPMRARLMADLRASPPSVVVVEHGDVFSNVTGNHLDSAQVLESFGELEAMLDADFVWADRIQDFDLYLRRADAP